MTNKGASGGRKGISPIIAIIILLLITVALAGAAWSYMSVYWTSITGKNIIITDGFCTEGNTSNILLRNTGTLRVTLSDIQVMDMATGAPVSGGSWTNVEGTLPIINLDQGKSGRFSVACSTYCTYRFIYGGTIGLSSQTVSVAC